MITGVLPVLHPPQPVPDEPVPDEPVPDEPVPDEPVPDTHHDAVIPLSITVILTAVVALVAIPSETMNVKLSEPV
jgi:hypothetical protein